MTARVAEGQILGARETQEDAVRVVGERRRDSEDDLLLILSDGMGGHAGGEVASNLAVDAFSHHFSAVSQNLRPRGRLSEALEAANGAIADHLDQAPDLRGMGCTLIATLVAGGRLAWVSVGDSILYLLRDGRLRRLNADHSLFGELMEHVDRGEMTLADAEAHPRRNALRAALTGDTIALIDVDAIEIDPGDVVILATDGIETLSFTDIERIAQEMRATGPEAIRSALLDAVSARRRPRQDNTSVVILAVDRAASSAVHRRRAPFWQNALGSLQSQIAVGAAAALVLGLAAFWLVSGLSDDPPPPAPPGMDLQTESRSFGGGSTAIDEPAVIADDPAGRQTGAEEQGTGADAGGDGIAEPDTADETATPASEGTETETDPVADADSDATDTGGDAEVTPDTTTDEGQ